MLFLQQNIISKALEYWKLFTFGLLLVLLLVTIKDGHNWGGDFSQYIHHAANLVNGINYSDIGYIHNTFSFVGPTAYPPVFPFVLAPIYALFGLNYVAFKVLIVFSFISSVYLSTIMFKNKLSNVYQFVFILVLALNPFFWLQKEKILSDYIFMLLVFITIWLLNKRYVLTVTGYSDKKSKNWIYAIFIGVLFYLNFATREIGIVFIPTIIVFELIHFRKITITTIMAIFVFVLLVGAQSKLIKDPPYNVDHAAGIAKLASTQGRQSDQVNHTSFIKINLLFMFKQAVTYMRELSRLWPASNSIFVRFAAKVAFFLFLFFVMISYIMSVIKGPGIVDIFIAGYIAVLLLFASDQGLRYFLPLIPISFFYAFKLHAALVKSKYPKAMIAVALVFVGSTTVSYSSSNIYSKDLGLCITDPSAVSFFNYVRSSTPKESIFIFQKPRVLSLLTQRQASGIPGGRGPNFLIDYMEAIGANYYVHSAIDNKGFSHPVSSMATRYDKLTLIFNNEYFYLYKRN